MKLGKIKEWLILFSKGSCMGIADLIPGVSGGTLALVLGVHSRLMEALKTLKPKAILTPKSISWFFLSAIASGILFSLASGAKIISHFLNKPSGFLALQATFFGLVVGSLFFCVSKVDRWSIKRVFLALLGVVLASSFILLSHYKAPTSHYTVRHSVDAPSPVYMEFAGHDFEPVELSHLTPVSIRNLLRQGQLDPKSWIYHEETQRMVLANSCFEFYERSFIDFRLIICGLIAICAMLLPGVSGSQVMVIFGYYDQVIHAIALWIPSFFKGNIINDSFWILANLGVGILLGVALFSRVATYLYTQYPSTFLSVLIGFMGGSLPAVWPFWTTQRGVQIALSGPYWQLEKLKPTFPRLIDHETWLALSLMTLSVFLLVFLRFFEKRRIRLSS